MEISHCVFIGDGAGRPIVDVYIEHIALLAAEGVTRVWSPQMPWEPDVISVQSAAFREVPRIELGTAVLPIQVAHPMLTAQRALTLSAASGGRFRLGLGLNHPQMSMDLWGVPWEKPVRRMNEYLDGLLPLLAGNEAHAVGEMVTTRGTLQIPHAPVPEVYLAAMGPQMLRLTGRRCAGTITWMTGPKTLAGHIGPTLREAAAAAGRPQDAVKVIAGTAICVTDDVDGARARAADDFALYGTLPSYRAMLDREGFAGPEDAVLIGDEATVADRIEELRAAGVDEFLAYPVGDGEESFARSRALLRNVADRVT
ncbi:LLM class F420-dependent oxidoreductase [Mycobacterium sp. 1100029.7]|nr:LLM class F420-dependent oxidoreductase [Mycobacterium sp. 1100029.7]